MSKITSATDEQWAQVEECRKRWLYDEQTAQYPVSEIRQTVLEMCEILECKPRMIWVVDSPIAARLIAMHLDGSATEPGLQDLGDNLQENLRDNGRDNADRHLGDSPAAHLHSNLPDSLHAALDNQDVKLNYYCGLWWNVWAGWYEGADILGVPRIKEYERFRRWNQHCPVWMWSDKDIFILKRPTEIHWSDGGLHNESGPAVKYSPIWNLWFINGVMVDEQIVMRPETQSLDQINKEENQETKRIRIERFGWDRYLTDNSAECIDKRENAIEGTREMLFRCNDMTLLRTFCPSTGKKFALEILEPVNTCSEAQAWLWNCKDAGMRIVGRT